MQTFTNDHEIQIGSEVKSLRLYRPLSSKMVEGPATYAVTEDVLRFANPLSFSQTDWSGGHGQYAFAGDNAYLAGANIETSLRGKITMSPYRTTSYSVYHLIDSAVADDGGALTTETTGAINSTTNDMTLLPAVPANDDAYYFGFDTGADGNHSLLLKLTTAGVGTWTINWEYYAAGAWGAVSSLTDNTTGFTATAGYLTVAFTTASWATTAVNSITKYWLRARVSGYSAVTTQPKAGQAWVSLASQDMTTAPLYTCWYKTTSSLFAATATKVFEYDSTNSRWIERKEFSGETISELREHDSLLYVALGIGTKWYYTSDGFAYTITDLADGYAVKFLVAPNSAGTEDRLWFFQTPNELMNTSDGRAAGSGGVAASTPAYIGDTSYNITNIFLVNDRLMVGKENGLWNYDSIGGQHALMTELEQNRSVTNFKYVAYYKGSTYFSLIRNCGEITPSDYMNTIGPLRKIDSSILKVGDIVGMTSDEDYLYVAVKESTDTHIYKGSQIVGADGALQWAWCPFANLTTYSCAVITMTQYAISASHLGQLWFGYNYMLGSMEISQNTAAETTLQYYALPGTVDSFLRTGYFYGSNPEWDKIWYSIVIETANCSSSRQVSVYYRDDNDTVKTSLVTGITTNGVQTINFQAPLSNKRISFEFWFTATLSTDVPPEILYFEAKGVEIPAVTRIHEATYEIGDSSSLKARTIWDFLDSARISTSLIKLADLRRGQKVTGEKEGDYQWVIMQPGYPKFIEMAHEAGRHPEMGIQCRWQEIDYTV